MLFFISKRAASADCRGLKRSFHACIVACGVTTGLLVSAFGQEVAPGAPQLPLHQRIDQLLDAAHVAGQAPIASDADFLRRACLSLHGVIPTAAEARAFFADPAPDKRANLIERLIADPQIAKWMAARFDLMLMERRPGKHVALPAWRDYLEASFAANKPWNVLAQELIANDGANEPTRAAARWTLEREGDPNALTKDASRIFLGRDLSCAQCHDHPKIEDYTQREYHGLFAFFSRTSLFQPDPNKPAVLAEKADGAVTYTSVFTKLGGGSKPRLVGEPEVAEPELAASDVWTVPPNDKDKNVRAIPKYSRRAELAKAFAEGRIQRSARTSRIGFGMLCSGAVWWNRWMCSTRATPRRILNYTRCSRNRSPP